MKPQKVHAQKNNKITTSEYYRQVADSVYRDFLNGIHEPTIDNRKSECFRFMWSSAFSIPPGLLLRIESDSNEHFTMTSKLVFSDDHSDYKDTLRIKYRGKIIALSGLEIVDSSFQSLSKEDYYEFRRLLNESYYWAFEDPCPNGFGDLDGDEILLESISRCCGNDTLKHHFNYIRIPRGPYREAYKFLATKSDVLKLDPEFRKMILRK